MSARQRNRPTAAVQDYLKAIFRVEEDAGRPSVSTSEVAEALGVTAPSASAMLKKLAQLDYVATPRRGVFELTEHGRSAALEVIRHHRLLETYLVTRLGVPLEEVHHEAEVLEHHISEALEARIAEALGHPERDPHGAPIPTLAGTIDTVPQTTLMDMPNGATGVVSRVADDDARTLRSLSALGIAPDVSVELVDHGAGGVHLRVGGGDPVRVTETAARTVRVDLIRSATPSGRAARSPRDQSGAR